MQLNRTGSSLLSQRTAAAAIRGAAQRFAAGARKHIHVAAASLTDAELKETLDKSKTELLVLGCGVAGCSTALKAAERGLKVMVLTSARDPHDCNSFWAQGGIIYKAKDDSPGLLSQDIMVAGAGVNDKRAVRKLAVEGPSCVDDLLLRVAQVPFDRTKDGNLALCLEASHNRARIIHWRDHTGRAITESLLKAVSAHPDITLLSGVTAVDLAMSAPSKHNGAVVGAHVLATRGETGGKSAAELMTIRANATVLATGGLGELYAHTSNPRSARGDGFAMAYRAGAAMQNMEFVQFHPTTLHLPGERSFLLTEALRGEGARLLNYRGEAFAKRYHPQGELAPRDVVSRMIVAEMTRTNTNNVFLDISHRDADWLRNRFPSIYKHCITRGLDMTKQPLPVVPAAHYFCGGVATDLTGRTSVRGLYAAGEVACTGLHGANRLASTSLLEGLVWGSTIAAELYGQKASGHDVGVGALVEGPVVSFVHNGQRSADSNAIEGLMHKVRGTMWDHVGVVRKRDGLDYATTHLRSLEEEIKAYYRTTKLSAETVSLRNAVQTARLIARAAARNEQSVGAHYVEEEEDDDEEDMLMMPALSAAGGSQVQSM